MSFSGFSNNHLFSFLFKHEEKDFINCFEPIILKKAAKLTIEPSNIFYYYIESGSVAVSFENGHQTLVLHAGDGFGRLPFAVTSDRYSITVLEESLVFRIDDERLLLYLLSDLKKIRGYLNAVADSGIETVKDNLISTIPDTAVIGVVGEVKSGKTLFSALLAGNLSETGRVLVVDASRSHHSLSALWGCSNGLPVVMKESNKDFDYQKYIVEVGSNISLINFSDGKKINQSSELLSALIVNTSFEFDYIVIDGGAASISEDIMVNCDYIFNMCRNERDKRSAGVWLDRFISEGQRISHVANQLFMDNCDGYPVCLSHIENINKSGFDEAAKNVKMDDAVSVILKKNIDFLHPYCYRSLPYVKLIESNPDDAYICTGFSLFFLTLYLHTQNKEDFIALMDDFFCKSRHKLLYKLVYPDERLYSADYFYSYVKRLFGKTRIEDLKSPVIALLSGESGRVSALSSGRIADIVTAAFSRKPYFNRHYVSGIPLAASYSGRKNIMYRIRGAEYRHVSIDTRDIVYPFKQGTFLSEMIKSRDLSTVKGDFVIDLSCLDLYNTKTLF